MGHHIIASCSHCLLRVQTPFYYTHLQYNRKPNGYLTQRRDNKGIRARECDHGHDAVMPALVALMRPFSWHVSVVGPESNRTSSNALSHPIHHELNRRRPDILPTSSNLTRCVKGFSMSNTVHRLLAWTPPSTYTCTAPPNRGIRSKRGYFSVVRCLCQGVLTRSTRSATVTRTRMAAVAVARVTGTDSGVINFF
jgi:hypothetical protein